MGTAIRSGLLTLFRRGRAAGQCTAARPRGSGANDASRLRQTGSAASMQSRQPRAALRSALPMSHPDMASCLCARPVLRRRPVCDRTGGDGASRLRQTGPLASMHRSQPHAGLRSALPMSPPRHGILPLPAAGPSTQPGLPFRPARPSGLAGRARSLALPVRRRAHVCCPAPTAALCPVRLAPVPCAPDLAGPTIGKGARRALLRGSPRQRCGGPCLAPHPAAPGTVRRSAPPFRACRTGFRRRPLRRPAGAVRYGSGWAAPW